MKKFTLLLMPVMPGFDAWAVNGFIEAPENPDDKEIKPTPVASDVLTVLVDGFTTPAGETVFVEYWKLGNFVHAFREKSLSMSIQPLDRGGLLVSCEPNEALWTRIVSCIENHKPADKTMTLSVSKSK